MWRMFALDMWCDEQVFQREEFWCILIYTQRHTHLSAHKPPASKSDENNQPSPLELHHFISPYHISLSVSLWSWVSVGPPGLAPAAGHWAHLHISEHKYPVRVTLILALLTCHRSGSPSKLCPLTGVFSPRWIFSWTQQYSLWESRRKNRSNLSTIALPLLSTGWEISAYFCHKVLLRMLKHRIEF